MFKPGLLQAGQVFCSAQALLDMDLWDTANAFFKIAPEVEDEIPFEDIYAVALHGGTFLECENTLKCFRDVMHEPRFLDRSARGTDEEELSKTNAILD